MTKQDMAQIVNDLRTSLEAPLRDALLKDIDSRIEQYRRAVWVREDWCCNEMRQFANTFWNAPKPRTDEQGFGVSYMIRSFHVNYCPFCGASVVTGAKP